MKLKKPQKEEQKGDLVDQFVDGELSLQEFFDQMELKNSRL